MNTKHGFLAAVSAAMLIAGAPAMIALTPTAAVAAKGSIGQKVGKPLQEAQKLAEAKQWQEAIAKAKEADAVADKSAYETLVVKDFLTYLYSNVRDYGGAAAAAEAALNTGQAEAGDVPRRVKLIAQLNYQVKNYAKAISFGERYLRDHGFDQGLAELVAQGYYSQKNYAKALDSAQDLIRRSGTPSENMLLLAYSSSYNLGRAGDANAKAQSKDLLFRLLENYPKEDYWIDLTAILLAATGNTERTNLEIFRAKQAAGHLKDGDEIQEMAQTALQLGLPGEAERTLQAAFDAGILGVGENASREKRLLTLAKTSAATDRTAVRSDANAAKASATGQDDVKIGEALETYGDLQGALALVQGGLAKEGVKNPDEARITLGRVQLKLGQKDAARATFNAVKTDAKMMDVARLWKVVARG